MKKIFYLFAITAFVFTSCNPFEDNPLEDVNAEVDALTANDALVADLVFSLTDEDYDALDLSFGNFSSTDDAKDKLPGLLALNYPQLGATYKTNGEIDQASSALVTYKLYNKKNDEKSLTIYEVTSDDYSDNGHRFGNFSSFSDISKFLDVKYPSAANRLLVSLTYKYFNGKVSTLENGFINNRGTWEMSTGITDDEYTAMGEGRAQFSFEDEALAKIPLFAKNKFQYDGKVAGDIEGIMYKLFVTDDQDVDGDGSTDDRTVYSFVTFVIYDGVNWSIYNNVIDEIIKLGHNGTTWVPDNTIKYTLTSADYESVGNGRFNNFDLRSGKDEETAEQRLVKINTILKNNFPNVEEGQKYAVTYAFFDGSNGTATANVVLEGADYIYQ